MANGPFGNPLTTGIALTFDVDMTPYDNMLKRNAAKAAEKAKADKDLLDKYNEFAKNITVDFDKIHWRLHPPARAKYAETLAELNKAVMNKDPHAANMLMIDSKRFNSNLVQRTSEWNEIFNQDPTKVYYDPSIKQKINDRSIPTEDAQINEIFTKYGTPDELIGSLKKAPSRRNLKTDVDNLLKGAKRRLQPGDKPTMYLPTGEAVYEPKYTNKDEIRNQVIMDYTSPQNIESTIYMLTEDYGISPSELQGKDIPETQEKLTAAIDKVFNPIWSSIESEQFKSRPPRDTGKKGSGMTFEDKYTVSDFSEKITDTQVSGIPSGTQMVGKAFNPKGDITSKAKGGYERLVTVSPNSYESIDGGPLRKPSRSGETVTINMVPMGIVALKGSNDKRVFAKYRYRQSFPGGPDQIRMHYEPLNVDELNDRNNIEFRDYAGLTDDEFVSYYNEVAGMAGFPKFKGSDSAAGTQPSGYAQITTLKDSSGNLINAGVKGGKWYNIDTGEEIK